MKNFRLAGAVVNSEEKFFYDLYGIDCISARQVHDFLNEAAGEDVTFNLNSVGGYVYEGIEIYTLLKEYSGHVTVNVTGLAASIASVIMLGGDVVNISNAGQIMIHNPSTIAVGSKEDLERGINSLDVTERMIANLYANKSNLSQEEFQKLMKKETRLTADEALEIGLVDNIKYLKSEDDLKLVDSYHDTMVALADFKKITDSKIKTEDIMAKSFIDKLKNALREADDITNKADVTSNDEIVETEEAEETETVVASDAVESTDESEEVETVETEEQSEAAENIEDVNAELVESLEKATTKIEDLTNENESLQKALAEKDTQIDKLQNSKSELEKNMDKATNVINKFNALLEAEEQTIAVVNTADHENSQSAFVGRFKHKQD